MDSFYNPKTKIIPLEYQNGLEEELVLMEDRYSPS